MYTHDFPARHYEKGVVSDREEPVIAERYIDLIINGQETVRLMALPNQIEELITGFLFCECIISRNEDIVSLKFNPASMSVEVLLAEGIRPTFSDKIRSVTTACGRGLSFVTALSSDYFKPVTSNLTLSPQIIIDLMRSLQRTSSLFRETGGVHSAAIAENGTIEFCTDDIGRHNAVDKAIGWLLRAGRLTAATENPCILLTTGRMASEIIVKAVRARFAILISPSAPTSGAIQIAEKHGLTLIGFARGERFNIYTHNERVVF